MIRVLCSNILGFVVFGCCVVLFCEVRFGVECCVVVVVIVMVWCSDVLGMVCGVCGLD